ncbi:hypothetical protein IWX90DRAFT_427196 [Phyllosticta citrichinensis]|uniref:Non-reducing end beta-L-arabinofuranosidase-like GH127 catalytic domain-containing protein n=1 Tax=Phyllosticta citrichinensis TaxID=1130410 RepID=A0ABR1XZB5_9PEZI
MSQEKQHASTNGATRRKKSCATQYLYLAFVLFTLLLAFLLFFDFVRRLIMMFLGLAAALVGLLSIPASAASTNSKLVPLTFNPLPLGSIIPSGWLRDQLILSAAGLAGHQHDFYPYVANSSWLGGSSEYSGLNEGFPYWLNGLVPLAYATDDARLKKQVSDAVTYVMDHQAQDGWLGPETGKSRNLWARYPLLLGLIQLVEAEPQTWEKPVLDSIGRFVGLMLTMLNSNGTGYLWHEGDVLSEGDTTWGRVRVQDLLITLQWLLERPSISDGVKANVTESMELLIQGAISWANWWQEGAFIKGDLNFLSTEGSDGPRYPYEHGVNAGQGLKALAVFRRFTHNDSLIDITRRGVDWTFQYHGAASGGILADERLAGLAPYYGSETCTLVETMYSLSYLYQAFGDNDYADQAERIAFNALPSQLSPDWWARQYVGQPNQGYSTELSSNPFFNVNNVGQTYGVENDYPCCTVNHPQGLPKFLSQSYLRVGDDGLAHALLSPASLATTLPNGAAVTVNCTTQYPFATTLTYSITASRPFTFHLRVPTWSNASSSHFFLNNSATPTPLYPSRHTGLHAVPLPAGSSSLSFTLSAPLTTTARANDTLTVTRGALVFALAIPGTNTSLPAASYFNTSTPLQDAPPQARDWRLANASAWNVAIDPSSLVLRSSIESLDGDAGGASSTEEPLLNPIFAPAAPPVWVEARGCEIGGWGLYKGVMDVPPPLAERACITGTRTTVRLEPMGAAKLRIVDLATVEVEEDQ